MPYTHWQSLCCGRLGNNDSSQQISVPELTGVQYLLSRVTVNAMLNVCSAQFSISVVRRDLRCPVG